ncbi:MAG: hypothetical protein QNK37_24105 [Acidobacteriota bacterium]|nr:hypothetical protein [Acidobacteriota bacterium]
MSTSVKERVDHPGRGHARGRRKDDPNHPKNKKCSDQKPKDDDTSDDPIINKDENPPPSDHPDG